MWSPSVPHPQPKSEVRFQVKTIKHVLSWIQCTVCYGTGTVGAGRDKKNCHACDGAGGFD